MKHDGGQAFPIAAYTLDVFTGKPMLMVKDGMTLRDYFAAQALAGFLSAHGGENVRLPQQLDAAKSAYLYADAMLYVRLGDEFSTPPAPPAKE